MSPEPGGPRNWDKELADIDKIIASTPPAKLVPAPSQPGGAPVPVAASPSRVSPAKASRREFLSTWFRVGLGVLLAAAMPMWPYFHACGSSLFIYLGAVGIAGLSGLWGAVTSWRRRMGLAHTVSLLVLAWGLALAAAEILPRIGYARGAARWWCP